MRYKLTIPVPHKAPTVTEEMLKLDLLELTKKEHSSHFALMDEVLNLLKKRGMTSTHSVSIERDSKDVEVMRNALSIPILKLEVISNG